MFLAKDFRTLYIAVRYPKSFDLMLFYVICRPLELRCVDIETEDVPSSMDCYGKLYNNIIIIVKGTIIIDYLDVTPTQTQWSGETSRPRVMSEFIQQMSAEKMIIPEEKIKLLNIVGQGIDYYIHYTLHLVCMWCFKMLYLHPL